MNGKYDVIVVGAGPAGASVARNVAESGFNTLIIDKKREIGHPIQCGELVPALEEFPKILPKTDRAKKFFNLPQWVISNKCSRVAIIGPSKKIHEFKFNSNIVDRRRFDKWLVMEAMKAGAKLWTYCYAIGAQSDGKEVIVKKEDNILRLKTDILVAADGPSSRMTKDIGLGSNDPFSLGLTIEYLMGGVDIDPDVVEVYFGKDYAPGGYAWIIPKGEGIANVGLGIRTLFSDKGVSVREYLNKFINNHPLTSKLRKGTKLSTMGGLVPTGGPLPKTYSDNVIAVGDAAGQVMPTNGGGIPTAVICGDIGGEAIVHKFSRDVSLELYEKVWRKEVGQELKKGVQIRKIMDIALKSDKITEDVCKIFGGRIIESALHGQLPVSLSVVLKTVEKLST